MQSSSLAESLTLVTQEVVDSPSHAFGIIVEGSEPTVARATQQPPLAHAGVAVVCGQDAVSPSSCGWSMADGAASTLEDQSGFVVPGSEAGPAFANPSLESLSVDSAPLSILCDGFGGGDPEFFDLSLLDGTSPDSVGSLVDADHGSALTAVASLSEFINLGDPVLRTHCSGAGDSVDSILLEGDSPAFGAVGLSMPPVQIGEHVIPESGSVALQVQHRFPFDPSTLSGRLGSGAGDPSASAVATSERDLAVLSGANAILIHRKDCTP